MGVTLRYCSENDIGKLFNMVRDCFYVDYGVKANTAESFRKYLMEAQANEFHDFFVVCNDAEVVGCAFSFLFNADSRCIALKIYLNQKSDAWLHEVIRLCVDFFSAKYSVRRIFLFSDDDCESELCRKIAIFPEVHFKKGKLVDSFCYELIFFHD